jgi:hypothetical protein
MGRNSSFERYADAVAVTHVAGRPVSTALLGFVAERDLLHTHSSNRAAARSAAELPKVDGGEKRLQLRFVVQRQRSHSFRHSNLRKYEFTRRTIEDRD